MTTFNLTEKHLSQIPALKLLANSGYRVLTPEQALAERGGKTSNVFLESILRQQLAKINRIHYKGAEYLFSEANIQDAIQKLKNIQLDGKQKTNEAIYDLLSLGTALEQTIEANTKSFNLNYIDWKTLSNNVFHVVAEYTVERSRSEETARPDIVLFVNGIPLAVIECKSPQVDVQQAVSQNIRNQGDAYIPKLFATAQLLLGVNTNAARYATTGTSAKFWSIWRETETTETRANNENELFAVKNQPLSNENKQAIEQTLQCKLSTENYETTEQDRVLYGLCRPQRLLELAHRFTLFEHGQKKIARYQQYFVVKSTLKRVKNRNTDGKRNGGVIWHTQGSGKSLTMVMLARSLLLDTEITNPRIILVNDRDDLDKQLGNTFAECGLSKKRATSGRDLIRHLKDKVGIVTTLIHKFDKGWAADKFVDLSTDIFVLVDESHRTNLDALHAAMKRMLPNACYIGFTGTPLLKARKIKGLGKNTFTQFDTLIKPPYPIKQAVEDKAVVPLLYEGWHVDITQNKEAIDLWFERHTAGLSKEQQAHLKREYARAEMLNNADRVIYMRAFKISEHYRSNWQNTGFKAQLVAPSKLAAINYHEYLKQIGFVSSEVIISAPDTREGHEEVDESSTDAVVNFWGKMMKRFGNENEYTKQVINQFKYGSDPEILIVVDKLLTGFDAPKNIAMYLCRPLREHKLLQAIARVNRLHEGKDFGYIIDYVSVLQKLDEALAMYDEFEGIDKQDLASTITSINAEVEKLPQRHSHLWDIFRTVKNSHDEEEFEVLLADDELRGDFYECLSEYSKTLALALGAEKFIMETDEAKLREYKNDLKRFMGLRKSIQLRYAEKIDFQQYEKKIAKLLDTHIQADNAFQLNEPVDILDAQHFDAVKQGQGIYSGKSTAAKADTIAHATKKIVTEKMDEDPAFYEKFSKLIQKVIEDFRARLISDLDYLDKISEIREKIVSRQREDVPEIIRENDEACAYYGMAAGYFSEQDLQVGEELIAYMSTSFQQAFEEERVVDFWNNQEAVNRVKGSMDDFFFDVLKEKYQVELKPEQMNEIIENTMQIAKNRKK